MENQKQQLSSFFGSLLPQSLASFDFALRKKLKMDDDGTGGNGFSGLVIHALLRWNANGRRWHHHHHLHRRRRRHCVHFLPILTVLSVVALLSFFSPPIAPTDQILRRFTAVEDGAAGGGLNLKGEEGRDLWRSRWSEFYFGCSNASRKFSKRKGTRIYHFSKAEVRRIQMSVVLVRRINLE